MSVAEAVFVTLGRAAFNSRSEPEPTEGRAVKPASLGLEGVEAAST